jgi:deferrochelatase/peroxidase EfeB
MELYPSTDPMDGLRKHKDPEENQKMVAQNLGQEGLDRLKTMKTQNNTDAFNYNSIDQTKCPYASHMRKTGPRDDCPNYTKHLIMRRGIPYGDWCSDDERAGGTTEKERGLLFVCYQSSIDNGFRTQQKRKWCNFVMNAIFSDA